MAMVYLDSNATTQIHPEVLEEMMPYLTDQWYNPSSGYRAAKAVRTAMETAHEQVASLIGADPEEIIFTGCGTEANNAALSFLARVSARQGGQCRRVVTSAIEHSAILRYGEYLQDQEGFVLEKVGVQPDGRLDLEAYRDALALGDVAFSSLMWANNETGVIQPMAEACEVARSAGVPLHSDAIQAVGKTEVNVREVPVDYLSISGHKLHAPKGVGALYIRRGLAFEPMLRGGGQEGGRRSGTENVASIVGLGKAAELMKSRLDADGHAGVARLRDHFEQRILSEITGVTVNGSMDYRTANTSHLSFDDCEAAGLLILLDEYGVQCSAGSACMTGKQKPSHVQTAMGIPADQARSSLRISLSILTTSEECDAAVEAVKKAVGKLRRVQGGPGVGPVQIFT
ncbi:aminotransferase class V-fold PLP-dependent enzyme [Verrucomicrobiaceae bacterium N1E253]|uniref:cysteine desulfurase n=1 Tax=Oceaniferula marina TaxID=2748318 RepID=A0A851GQQ7_9BACT|nr:aminotransferase class V-fold PLP-dependent enzyme [Oceaniferula marina]NWK57445.1 aminotransferase class V-fold PLP-dependent enzyme [Oceaniferula marina]